MIAKCPNCDQEINFTVPGSFACNHCKHPIEVIVQNPRLAQLNQMQPVPQTHVSVNTGAIARAIVYSTILFVILFPLVSTVCMRVYSNSLVDSFRNAARVNSQLSD